MKTGGIVAEYNPFHNGHAYQIAKVREAGFTHIAAVMSGNFVQRGEAAIAGKFARARMAVQGGVDLVLELPLPYCAATAQKFAWGGVRILHGLGCADALAFGCENDDTQALLTLAEFLSGGKADSAIQSALESGVTYAAARQAAVEHTIGKEYSELLNKPNNILSVEYLQALVRLKSPIKPLPILRKGCGHDSQSASGNFASASLLRTRIQEGEWDKIKPYVPESVYGELRELARKGMLTAGFGRCDRAVLSRLRTMTLEDFRQLPDISEGLEHRIFQKVKEAVSVEDLIASVKTKRYTHARLRRIVLCAFLGITAADFHPLTAARVLAMNSKGAEIIKQASGITLFASAHEAQGLDSSAQAILRLEDKAFDLFGLCTPAIQPCGKNRTHKTEII